MVKANTWYPAGAVSLVDGSVLESDERHHVPEQWVDPAADNSAHVIAPTCWCQPELRYEDAANGGQVWVHKGDQA